MTLTCGAERVLTGQLTVALPPEQAFRLFTPRGEADWAAGWNPRFPAGTSDDTAPGTVFQTQAHDQSATWIVLDRVAGHRMRYARVIPLFNAGTVTVTLGAAGGHSEGDGGHSEVTVTYELTALTETGARHLHEFAEHYPAFLRSWQDAIAAVLDRGPTGPGHTRHG